MGFIEDVKGNNMKNQQNQKSSPFDVVLRLVMASYPVSVSQIERELLDQCQFTSTKQDASRQAQKCVKHGVERGVFEICDGEPNWITLAAS